MIICDASPLIHLTKMGKMEYVMKLFDTIIIPPAVYREIIEEGIQHNYDDAKLLQNYHKNKQIQKLTPGISDVILEGYLDRGEYEALLLTQELDLSIIIDERKGRFVAEQRNFSFLSTMDIVLLLLKEKVIDYSTFEKNLGKYSAKGWVAKNVIQKYLEKGKQYE